MQGRDGEGGEGCGRRFVKSSSVSSSPSSGSGEKGTFGADALHGADQSAQSTSGPEPGSPAGGRAGETPTRSGSFPPVA